MKQLMLGNAAVARGLYEAGCCVISSYPGTPSTEITEEAVKFPEIYCEWAPNEKVAMEVAFGASLAGKRSFCGMKHVGLNVAADPLFTMSYTGVNGGVVIGVADDAGMHSSQNEQDSRHHAIAAKVPITMEEMTVSEAKAQGAMGLFESKYGEVVRVYTMGPYSKEICGGPHANNTGDLVSFKIIKEEASSAGVRRIKATIGRKAE